jgi:hypothetical protein
MGTKKSLIPHRPLFCASSHSKDSIPSVSFDQGEIGLMK